jgi:hypothetical protein
MLFDYLFKVCSAFDSHQHYIPIRIDHRTRRDRAERRDRAFDEQIDACAEAYMDWNSKGSDCMEDPLPADSGSSTIKVVGIYGSKFSLSLDPLLCSKYTYYSRLQQHSQYSTNRSIYHIRSCSARHNALLTD